MRKAILSFTLLSVLAVLHVNAAADRHPSLDTLYVLGGELSNSAATSINDIDEVMMSSREACVDYMMPLGLHHIFKFDPSHRPCP